MCRVSISLTHPVRPMLARSQFPSAVAALTTVDQVAYAMIQANRLPDASGNSQNAGSVELASGLRRGAVISYPDSLTHVFAVEFPLNASALDLLRQEPGFTFSDIELYLLCSSSSSPGRWSWNASSLSSAAGTLIYRLAGLGAQTAASAGVVAGNSGANSGGPQGSFNSYDATPNTYNYGGNDITPTSVCNPLTSTSYSYDGAPSAPPQPPLSPGQAIVRTVVQEFTASGTVADFDQAQQDSFIQVLAAATNVDVSKISLSVSAASIIITATFAAESDFESAALINDLVVLRRNSQAQLSAQLGVQIESVAAPVAVTTLTATDPPPTSPPPSPPEPSPPPPSPSPSTSTSDDVPSPPPLSPPELSPPSTSTSDDVGDDVDDDVGDALLTPSPSP